MRYNQRPHTMNIIRHLAIIHYIRYIDLVHVSSNKINIQNTILYLKIQVMLL